MRISNNYNNLSFGYNRALNNALMNKTKEFNTSENEMIRELATTCNATEDLIQRLEGPNFKHTQKNKRQINLILNYFIEAKTYLASLVDEFYPSLNFSKIETDSYRKIMENADFPDNAFDKNSEVDDVFLWRAELADSIEEGIDVNAKKDYKAEAKEKMKSIVAVDELVEKFKPSSYSPKSLDDVAGLKPVKDDIEDLIIFPLEHPAEAKERKENYGIDIPNFILFYGPPGCGKTMLTEAIAQTTGSTMYKLDLSKIGSSYINRTSSNIAKVIDAVKKEAETSPKPIILFMDEMDSILSKRDGLIGSDLEDNKVVNTLLPLITSLTDKNVMVIGATNMYNLIDPAAIRRADLELYIGLGDKDDIIYLLKNNLSKIKMAKELVDDEASLDALAQKLVGYSPSNIVKITKQASKLAYRKNRQITSQDFEAVISEGTIEKTKEQDYMKDSKKAKHIGFIN